VEWVHLRIGAEWGCTDKQTHRTGRVQRGLRTRWLGLSQRVRSPRCTASICHNTDDWVAPGRRFIIVVFTNCRSGDNATFSALDAVAGMLVNNYSSAVAGGPLLEAPASLRLRFVNSNVAVDYRTSTYTDTAPGMRKFYRAKVGP
jgi:hypothetical protein